MFPRPDSRPLAPILLPRDVSISATKVALHTAVHDSAFIACSRAVGDAGASFGFDTESVAMKSVRYALGEGWEALWMSFRALDPDWERNIVYWREFTMRVARPAFQDAFWDKLPNRHIPRKIAEKFVEATFDAVFEAGWSVTVSILRLQSNCLHAAHRAARRSGLSTAWDVAYMAAFRATEAGSSERTAA